MKPIYPYMKWKAKYNKLKGLRLDWLQYTVHEVPQVIDIKGRKMGHYPMRSASGRINSKSLAPMLQTAIPECMLSKNVTITDWNDAKDRNIPRVKNYDTLFVMHTIDGETVGSIAWHSINPGQGIHVTLRGEHLNTLRGNAITDEILLEQILKLGGKIRRMDIALDIKTWLTPINVYNKILKKQIESIAKNKPDLWLDKAGEGGEGVYIGSRSSTRAWRYYDKGKEQKSRVEERPWMRLEAILRDEQSEAWARGIVRDGLLETFRVLAYTYFHKWDELRQWLQIIGPLPKPCEVGRKIHDQHNKWVVGVALPAVLELLQQTSQQAEDLRYSLLTLIEQVGIPSVHDMDERFRRHGFYVGTTLHDGSRVVERYSGSVDG